MRIILCYWLTTKSDINRYKIVNFISKKFNEDVSITIITRALDKYNITLKVIYYIVE